MFNKNTTYILVKMTLVFSLEITLLFEGMVLVGTQILVDSHLAYLQLRQLSYGEVLRQVLGGHLVDNFLPSKILLLHQKKVVCQVRARTCCFLHREIVLKYLLLLALIEVLLAAKISTSCLHFMNLRAKRQGTLLSALVASLVELVSRGIWVGGSSLNVAWRNRSILSDNFLE